MYTHTRRYGRVPFPLHSLARRVYFCRLLRLRKVLRPKVTP
jgi:hypothetical protein